ncbi:MAG: D-alanine--D-alanine ligase [Candidatus Omnitrophica bacterium]|nr:D-alanine--D-alanine ligase [Candidatus Omnitrophota bacterium]
MPKLKVGVLSGGTSSERPISLRSGKAVLNGLKKSGFSVLRIDPKDSHKTRKALRRIDLAFIALHGKGGEDGTIQSRLEKAKIPYVGSNPKGSRLAIDKAASKRIFERSGIPTPSWRTFSKRNWKELESFPTPFFVKPIDDGSSIGVFLIEDFPQSVEKLIHALVEYPLLLAERRIEGREFTVGILGKRALPVVELKPRGEFYDYHCKYTKGMTEYLVPAPIPDAWRRRFQQLALKAHQALGLRDFSRIDLMADSEGNPYVLEANTIPGFTELSLLPKAAKEAGISFEELCSQLVRMAWKRRNGKA